MWDLITWEVDQTGVDLVGIDLTGIDPVVLNRWHEGPQQLSVTMNASLYKIYLAHLTGYEFIGNPQTLLPSSPLAQG